MQSFEQVNDHVEKTSSKAIKAAKKGDIKTLWVTAKPIFNLIANFPLIPKKWRDIVTGFVTLAEVEFEQ